MRAGISDPTRPDAAKELGGLQIIDNRPRAVSLPRPDEFSRLALQLQQEAQCEALSFEAPPDAA
jgi:hypothetical protein